MTALMRSMTRERRQHPTRWLRDLLRADALSGGFAGHVLPSEPDLMLTYGATRSTVREALHLLAAEGIVERLQGTGTLVIAQRYARRLVEVHGVVESDFGLFASKVLARRPVPMPPSVARYLEQAPGSPCLLLEYLGALEGMTIGVYTNYIAYPEADALEATPFDTHWYQFLADAGLQVGETDLLIEALAADSYLAELLNLSPGDPLLAMQQVIRNDDGRPYNYAILRSRGDRLSLLSRAGRPGAEPIPGA
jgi:GntR family transcriptional regulator